MLRIRRRIVVRAGWAVLSDRKIIGVATDIL
jgi:hypothetical protein